MLSVVRLRTADARLDEDGATALGGVRRRVAVELRNGVAAVRVVHVAIGGRVVSLVVRWRRRVVEPFLHISMIEGSYLILTRSGHAPRLTSLGCADHVTVG